MAWRKINDTKLTAIADAIRAKKDTTAVLTPAQMAEEIESIVIGDDLPNAEDAYFGTPSVETGYTTSAALSSNKFGSTFNVYGYQFTVNTPISFVGFRYMNGNKGSCPAIFTLWDVQTETEIAKLSVNTVSSTAWMEYRLDSPINMEVGKSYAVTSYAQCFSYATSISAANPIYNTSIGNIQYPHYTNAAGYAYPTVWTTRKDGSFVAIDMLIGEHITESVTTDYKVQVVTMDDIADEVKRIKGTSGKLTTAQIITALQSIPVQTT